MNMMRAIPFRPKLEGGFRSRFYLVASRLPERDASVEDVQRLVSEELAWVENECGYNLSQRRRYRAVWLLLRDLVQSSWEVRYRAGVVELRLPELDESRVKPDEIADKKRQLREWLSESRLERLQSFGKFIAFMEAETAARKSVLALVADGPELAKRISSGEVRAAIKPYLQLVTDSARDEGRTNHKLMDIWRYFRLTWSTPSESTPGRTIKYLIRDAAHPNHAVMGIFSLENCAVQITDRDEFIGWNAEGYIRRMLDGDTEQARESVSSLLRYVADGIEGLRHDDLCTAEKVNHPDTQTVAVLLEKATAAEDRRQELLAQDEGSAVNEERSELGYISKETEEALYRRKRAEQLARLLETRIALTRLQDNPAFADLWRIFLVSESGRIAVRASLVAQKSRHIGTSLLELNVCGAIPPYNEILGGKLAALLALSPQVVADYRKVYGKRESDIATRMKGEPVVRPAELVYVGTTSLYYVGSSQYNRVKLPPDVLGGGYGIEWKQIGRTLGFGTLHISKATTAALVEATDDEAGFTHINHVFGEGASPKLRLVNCAIRELLETDQDGARDLAKHAMKRIIYGALIAKNARAYLMGLDAEPEYCFSESEIETKTEAVVRFWQDRWLASRMRFELLAERLCGFSPEDLRVSNDLGKDRSWSFKKLEERNEMSPNEETPNEGKQSGLDFVRNLYRGVSAYADKAEVKTLSEIHIETQLDKAVVNAVKNGKDTVLTGSPGDGKTHLIRMLLAQFTRLQKQHPEVELDASCLTEEELFEKWQKARRTKRPFVLAVNAAVLYALSEKHRQFAPATSAKRQLLHAVTEEGKSETDGANVVVFDLSRRDVLHHETVSVAITKITADVFYSECEGCRDRVGCPVHKHRKLLRIPLFQERLNTVLTRISLKGEHVSLREVLAFLSFLLFGDRDCRTLNKTAETNDYHLLNLIYEKQTQGGKSLGRSRIFDFVRSAFDPVTVCHPVWDEQLLAGRLGKDTWADAHFHSEEDIGSAAAGQIALRKREFFFFNTEGKAYLEISDDETSCFARFLAQDNNTCVKELTGLLNQFFGTRRSKTEIEAWSGHRFDHAPRKILLSVGSISANKFEVVRPAVSKNMSVGIAMTANKLFFRLKERKDITLKVDFNLFSLLLAAEHGAPMLFIESNAAKRIWRFMEQVQGVCSLDGEEAEVSMLDVNEKKIYRVKVDLAEKRYLSVKQEKTEG
jgi:hypothetical protein